MFDLIALIFIGALAGWGAGYVMKGKGFGLLGNIAVGVAGALLGGFLFGLSHRKYSWLRFRSNAQKHHDQDNDHRLDHPADQADGDGPSCAAIV